MKKLFALVLTLALVFAIAAPAMALTWGAEAPVTGSPFAVTVETYKVTSDALNPIVYAPLGNTAVVEATPVAFKITIKVPTTAQAEAYYYDLTNLVPFATVEITNLVNIAKVDAATGFTVAAAKDAITVAVPATGAAVQTMTGFFTATVATTAKALVEVAAGYKLGDKNTDGKVDALDVSYNGYTFTANTVTKGANVLTLVKSGDVVTGWSLKAGTVTATIVSPTMFVVTADTAATNPLTAGTVLTTGAAFDAVNTVYKAFVALLGFDVTTAGINFTDANIVANYGAGGKTTATGTFLPYTSSLTVTDGTAVPNTGDNMSVIGFVMVGLAIFATAAVVVKKVRA